MEATTGRKFDRSRRVVRHVQFMPSLLSSPTALDTPVDVMGGVVRGLTSGTGKLKGGEVDDVGTASPGRVSPSHALLSQGAGRLRK